MSAVYDHYLGIFVDAFAAETVLCDGDGHIVYHAREDVSEQKLSDSGSVAWLCQQIGAAHDAAGVIHLCVSVAMSVENDTRETLREALAAAFPSDHIRIGGAVDARLSAELCEHDGVLLICEASGMCYARHHGQLTRIGGWGYALDSGGGAYAMGREALEAALRTRDGRGDATLLTSAVSERLGGAPWERLADIEAGGAPLIISLASCVLRCNEEGDRVAFEILWRQARYLSECIEAAYQMIGAWEQPVRVLPHGALLDKTSPMSDLLKQQATVPLCMIEATTPPVFGAVWEAMRSESQTAAVSMYMTCRENFLRDHAGL